MNLNDLLKKLLELAILSHEETDRSSINIYMVCKKVCYIAFSKP